MEWLPWLLDGDPAIRWQVMRDLSHSPPDQIAEERTRVSQEGWGARLLSLQGDDGQWAGGACFPAKWSEEEPGQPWTSTLPVLHLLVEFGISPDEDRVQEAKRKVDENCGWCDGFR